jgi:hypothetical protein
MSAPVRDFLGCLGEAAETAAAAETAFRREATERIKILEQERAFAFRRLNVMRSMAGAAADAESEEIAVGACLAVLRSRLGWSSDSESRSATLQRFAPVAQAFHASLKNGADNSAENVRQALASFEDWYQATYAVAFWSLFEHPMTDTPVVDF